MSDHGYALFIKRPRRIDDLRAACPDGQEREYVTAGRITLTKTDYENFAEDMLADRQFLEDGDSVCGVDGELLRCLEVRYRGCRERILVLPKRERVDMAALLTERDV